MHAVEEENLKQVAVALKAAERLIGDNGESGSDDYGDPEAVTKVRHSISKVILTIRRQLTFSLFPFFHSFGK